jgi:hypothetical protein
MRNISLWVLDLQNKKVSLFERCLFVAAGWLILLLMGLFS